jgi:hypothetical protein
MPAPVLVIRIMQDDPIITDAPFFYDPSDAVTINNNMKAFHLLLDHDFVQSHEVDTLLNSFDNQELLGFNEPFDSYASG